MVIRGEKIYLKALETDDAKKLLNLALASSAHKSTTPYWRPWTLDDFHQYITKSTTPSLDRITLGIFCLTDNNESRLIGTFDLHKINWIHGHAEIGLIIWPDKMRGIGLGTDTLKTGVTWAFLTLRLHRLFAKTFETNVASIKCFKKVGFREEGRWRSHYFINGVFVDAILLGLLADEYELRPETR